MICDIYPLFLWFVYSALVPRFIIGDLMRKILLVIISLHLTGCLSVYGPTKTGNQPAEASSVSGGAQTMPGQGDATLIGNRKPNEIHSAIGLFFQKKGLKTDVNDPSVGIVAAVGSDETLASLYLDCSTIEQTQNVTERYRIVAQSWSAGEGTHIAVQVSGVAGLITPDGNDKIKPAECSSTGLFEKDLLEALRK